MTVKLHDMEHIREVYRQSAFVLTHNFVVALLVIAVTWYFPTRFELPAAYDAVAYCISAVAILYFLEHMLLWRLTRYVVTNERLIQIQQKRLFSRSIIETPHDRILNVSYKTEGFVSALVGYGDVEVQVVGLVDPIVLKNISQPVDIKDYLWEMHRRATENSNSYSPEEIANIQQRVGYTNKKRS